MRSKHKWFTENPGTCVALTLTTYPTTATNADDTVTGTGIEALATGTEVVLGLDGGTAAGLTTLSTYFIIENTTNKCKLASTYALAIAGTAVNITGDAGAGDIFPVYDVNGFIYVGTGDALSIRGIQNVGKNKGGCGSTATTPDNGDAFCLHKNIGDGTLWPWAIGAVHSYCASGTCASDLIVWRQ